MLIILPIGLLLIASIAIFILNLKHPRFGVSWLIASGACIAAWLMVLFSRLRLPTQVDLISWDTQGSILKGNLSLLVRYQSWPYAIGLITVGVAMMLSDAPRTRYDSTPHTWSASLIIIAFGLLAIQSGTSLTMMIAWVIIDLLELFNLLILQETTQLNFRIVVSYGVRTGSILLLFLATILGTAATGKFYLTQIPTEAAFIFLLAAGVRLGVFPLNLPFLKEPILRRGAGNLIRMVPVTASLSLLAQLPVNLLSPNLLPWKPFFMALLAVAGFYGAIRWVTSLDEVEGRQFWIIGWASIAAACVLNGVPSASIPWGMALILPGSLLFFYEPRIQRMNFLFLFGLLGLLGLPYLLLVSGWEGLIANGFSLWTLLFIVIHGFLVLGYINKALQPGGEVGALESWARIVYPLSFILIILMIVFIGVVGWPGSFVLGVWWMTLISTVFLILATLFIRQLGGGFPNFKLPVNSATSKVFEWVSPRLETVFRLEWIYKVIWNIYKFIGNILNNFSMILEGEGGILWTVLILVLLLSILSGA